MEDVVREEWADTLMVHGNKVQHAKKQQSSSGLLL